MAPWCRRTRTLLLALGVTGCGAEDPNDPEAFGEPQPASSAPAQPGPSPAPSPATAAPTPTATAPGPAPSLQRDTSIAFTWPEAVPGQAGTGNCRAGHYVGTFFCEYTQAGGGFVTPVNGSIDMFLFESANGEFLEVQNGRLEGLALGTATFGADMIGALDCATGRFEGGLLNGAYSFAGLYNGAFEGPLSADYDGNLPALVNGVWSLVELSATSQGTCTGVWGADWVP